MHFNIMANQLPPGTGGIRSSDPANASHIQQLANTTGQQRHSAIKRIKLEHSYCASPIDIYPQPAGPIDNRAAESIVVTREMPVAGLAKPAVIKQCDRNAADGRKRKQPTSKKISPTSMLNNLTVQADQLSQYGKPSEGADFREKLLRSLSWFSLAREKRRMLTHGSDKDQNAPLLSLASITPDNILEENKFCNIHREDDRVSIALMKSHLSKWPEKPEQLSNTEYNNLLYQVLLGRFVHDHSILEKLGDINCSNPEPLREKFRELEGPKIPGAYQTNAQYANYGATQEDLLFSWLPSVVIGANLFDSPGSSIEGAIKKLHKAMPTAIENWFGDNPVRFRTKNSLVTRYQLDRERGVVSRQAENRKTEARLNQFRLPFIFSQGLMDVAALPGNFIDPESPPVPGPGAKIALKRLWSAGNKKIATSDSGYCSHLTELKQEMAASGLWPEQYLGKLDCKTLEHTLCEWSKWLKIKYLNGRGKPYV